MGAGLVGSGPSLAQVSLSAVALAMSTQISSCYTYVGIGHCDESFLTGTDLEHDSTPTPTNLPEKCAESCSSDWLCQFVSASTDGVCSHYFDPETNCASRMSGNVPQGQEYYSFRKTDYTIQSWKFTVGRPLSNTCSEPSSNTVLTRDTCQAAAHFFGRLFLSGPQDNYPDYPSGCFWNMFGPRWEAQYFFWNHHPTGAGNRKARVICNRA